MLLDPPTSLSGEVFHVAVNGTLDHNEKPRAFAIEGNDANAIKRFLCCALISKIPNDGIEECLSTIMDINQFYSVVPSQVLPSPSVEKVRAALA